MVIMHIKAGIEKLFAGKWIAGYYPEDALEKTKLFNSKKISTLINFLGENFHEKKEINETVDIYIKLIKEIRSKKLKASLSVKPTQIGLYISYALMYSNYIKIVNHAKKAGIFVWFDMETTDTIESTIKAYKSAIRCGNTGICIQAYLKRSEKDLESLQKYGAKIRLVKGAYRLNNDMTFSSKIEVTENYILLMNKLFKRSNDFMLATHDSRIVEEAIKINFKRKKRVTYAVLNGIRNKYAEYLARHGNNVAVYVPFGSDWIGYAYRRLVEQGHMYLMLRSLFERQKV
jgi:proline dehydrogenase